MRIARSERHSRAVLIPIFLLLAFSGTPGVHAQSPVESVFEQVESDLDRNEWDAAIHRLNGVLEADPHDIRAHYLRGIARREKEKSYSLLSSSIEDFEWVLQRDSLYRDVLFQYGLTLAYRNQDPTDRRRAIALTEELLRRKPNLVEVRFKLDELYRLFIRGTAARKARTWLQDCRSGFAAYFEGELLRQESVRFDAEEIVPNVRGLEAADKVFAALLDRRDEGPDEGEPYASTVSLLLSRAKVQYALGRNAAAQALVLAAVDSVADPYSAQLVFNDIKYIVSGAELKDYMEIDDPDAFRAFFAAFWERRDPLPALDLNLRMTEHYRRLLRAENEFPYLGFRASYNTPILLVGHLPRSYGLVHEFDDRGIIYIRHSEPLDKEVYVGPAPTSAESWLYRDPEMHFHFSTQETTSHSGASISGVGNYRLNALPHPVLVPQLRNWSGDYSGLINDRDLVATTLEQKMLEYVDAGLTTDTHSWQDEIEPLNFPFTIAAFKGDNGQIDVNIYYALPVGALAARVQSDSSQVEVETGLALHSSSWEPRGSTLDVKRFPADAPPGAVGVDVFQFTAPPDSYRVALHARLLPSKRVFGAYQFGYRLPDLNRPQLAMSDVVLAYRITPTSSSGRMARNGLLVEANPSGEFTVDRPLNVYFEIYGLSFGRADRTSYTMTYTLRERDEKRGILGLFRKARRGRALSIQSHSEGDERSPVEYSEIDVKDVAPGKYELVITVTDEHLGTSVSHSRFVSLQEK